MSKELIARMRKQREFRVTVGRWTFTACRPTDEDAVRWHRGNVDFVAIAREIVVGWEGVTEDDIVGGGGTDPVKFDRALWEAWAPDRPDLWEPLAMAALEQFNLHREALEAAGKN